MSDTAAAWDRFEAAVRGAGRIEALFEAEPDRLARLSLETCGLYLDLSKTPLSAAALQAGLALARAAGLEARRTALFAGEAVNASEHRAALHMALRAPTGADYRALGKPVSPQVDQARARMAAFAEGLRSGAIRSAAGRPFRAVVHIGIGGSDLGPRLVWEAL
ncbi:MAG TPA: glucose-6-phosphate isomerase, partial [Caulobacteraceae bacterium]|nr:glucose-6-phosphate isomerase [Caulobacteraceae bacterium]